MAVIFIRTLIVFFLLLAMMRLLGKRQLGELELSELIVSVLVADIAALPLQEIGIPLLYALIPITILFCCELLISTATVKSIRLRTLLCGRPSLLIENGVILQREMAKSRFTIDELAEELRKQSITDISKVRYAILETDGTLNTILRSEEMPVTAAQLGLTVQDNGFPIILINDGHVLSENLQRAGRDARWLQKQLRSRGVRCEKDVFLLSIDGAGAIYFAKKEPSA